MARQITLASRPVGWPTADNFALVEVDTPAPAEGQLVVRNLFMSVDPYMRGRMNDVKSYVPPFQLGQPLDGGAVGEVVESRADGFGPGDLVLHGLGWRDVAVLDARHVRKVAPLDGLSPSAYLGVLGMTSLTAYAGLLDVAEFKPGDAVFVSGAAGAVGSIAGQIAKLKGASRVIGSAGSAEKVAHLLDLGFDAAFNYKDAAGERSREPQGVQSVAQQLKQAAPDGIDVYFDNVGGDHLEAAISSLNQHGRVALCGAIAAYNDTAPPAAPRNLALAIGKRLTLRGFIVNDHSARMPEMVAEISGWLRDGKLSFQETVVDGLDNAPDAFLGLLRGENTGKMVVRI
ncbi:MAG: NADP-dependent oxidoreductase [Hamadaea sp.]|uniref:NADP-dependent oxidoreductase n=1 Tax=Hamadaea sp. TaxID=2024425 RepID=UPI0017A89D28|nr:NADP-dependent oxidoreductase [Hamadaea sp.]NUR72144.1 NADP-dependent oxidoreductase [Hamadaea sp.]NUT21329.1 NADP-dependent oxidoreductase [Hamadaea sp.]